MSPKVFTMDMEPTPYIVSTITCNGSVGTAVTSDVLFNNIHIKCDDKETRQMIYCEYQGSKKGSNPNEKKKKKPTATESRFDNQVTVIFRLGVRYAPNIKIFRNGNLHMTGVKKPEDAEYITHALIDEIRRIAKVDPTILVDPDALTACPIIIRMINTNFSVPYLIRRKDLHKMLISSEYQNLCDFQPGSYPGVKLKYFWNTDENCVNGICACTKLCEGKGCGSGNGQCKKVTVSVFESGNILITGANQFVQVDDAYAYICAILKEKNDRIRKNLPMPAEKVTEVTA